MTEERKHHKYSKPARKLNEINNPFLSAAASASAAATIVEID